MKNIENTEIKMKNLDPNKPKGFWNTKRRIIWLAMVMTPYFIYCCSGK